MDPPPPPIQTLYHYAFTKSDCEQAHVGAQRARDIAFLAPIPLQTRSQAPSSLPPLVVRRKTLVAAGHVTTQKLGGKKICWAGGVTEFFDCCCCNLCGFQNLEQSLKTTRCIGVWCGILPVKNVALFLPSPKYRRLAFTKKFGSRMELKLFDG